MDVSNHGDEMRTFERTFWGFALRFSQPSMMPSSLGLPCKAGATELPPAKYRPHFGQVSNQHQLIELIG